MTLSLFPFEIRPHIAKVSHRLIAEAGLEFPVFTSQVLRLQMHDGFFLVETIFLTSVTTL